MGARPGERHVEEYCDELEHICMECIELSLGGPVVAVDIPTRPSAVSQWRDGGCLGVARGDVC